MHPLLRLPLLLMLGCMVSPLHAELGFLPTPDNETSEDKADREKAIAEANKANEAQRKAFEAWLALPEEQRRKETERKARLPLPGDGYDWRVDAKTYNLTPADQDVLQRQKLAIGRTEFRQSFEPYDQPKGPVFITSDSLLNVYHVLFEDSFRELEIRRAVQLKAYLESMVTQARVLVAKRKDLPGENVAAWSQAQLAIGPAMRLLGTPVEFFDESLRATIEKQVGLIVAADGTRLPEWLAPATPDFLAIDYGRFRPVGFYAGSALLENYFRAVRWLQVIPFRVERDQELGAIALLCAEMPKTKSYPETSYLQTYDAFLGSPDGRTLEEAPKLMSSEQAVPMPQALEDARKWMKPASSKVKDGLWDNSRSGQSGGSEPFHLLCGYVLPESVVFQTLQNRGKSVTGLQFAALNGSQWAFSHLNADQSDAAFSQLLTRKVDAWAGRSEEDYLYTRYRRTIASLFAPADPDAPAFMNSEAWSAKSCQSALASWVQMRHTFSLQAKVSISTTCGFTRPPGFIEPNPAFLRSFVTLVRTTREEFEAFALFESSAESVANGLREKADFCDKYVELSKTMPQLELQESLVGIKVREMIGTSELGDLILVDENGDTALRSALDGDAAGKLSEALPAFARFLRETADRYESKKLPLPEERPWKSFKTRWQRLDDLATRLEALLQKQLRQRDWDTDEAAFIEEYGASMAYLMGYFGNVHSPQDDSPRWVEIADFPPRGTLFAVATGRPRPIYVLYPWHGVEVLCVGTVSPYYEYEATQRMTDSEWTRTLGKPESVRLPSWSQSLYLRP